MAAGTVLMLVAAALLWAGAEMFVEHAAAAGRRLGTTALAVGLLLAGAEPEELITAVIAALRGRGGIAAGDAIGANVTMLTLVLGLAALIRPLPVRGRVRLYLAGAGGAGVAAALIMPGGVSRIEGVVLIGLYAAAVAVVWRRERRLPAIGELAEIGDDEGQDGAGLVGLVLAVAGIGVMASGGWLAVNGAERLVVSLGVEESVVGLSIVALATTAELFALVASAHRRGLAELAVAGVIGSAGYNATMTLGGAGVAGPIATGGIVGPAWLAASLPLVIIALGGRRGRLRRGGALLLLAGYVGYLVVLFR